MTILSASSVQTLVHCVVKYSRPPDLEPSSNVSLPFAWITGPATDPSLKFYYLRCLEDCFHLVAVPAFHSLVPNLVPPLIKRITIISDETIVLKIFLAEIV